MSKNSRPYRGGPENRAFDLAMGTCFAVTGSPLAVISAAAICIESGTLNPFFTQHRLTGDDETFTILKFKTLRDQYGADPDNVTTFGADDPRCTRIGRIIRPLGIDEWANLWNVFKGDLSMVGPRPQIMKVMLERERTAREYGFLDVYREWRGSCYATRRGIFGAGQILAHQMGRYAETDPTAIKPIMEADITTELEASLLNDLKAVVATPAAVLFDSLKKRSLTKFSKAA